MRRRSSRASIAPVIVLGAIAAACGDDPGSTDPSVTSTSVTSTSVTSTSVTSTSVTSTSVADPSVVVSWHRTGGFAGDTTVLTVTDDGMAQFAHDRPAQDESLELDPIELDDLTRRVEEADLGTLPDALTEGCADCFVYTVSDGVHDVSWDDSNDPPDELEALLAVLGRLRERLDG